MSKNKTFGNLYICLKIRLMGIYNVIMNNEEVTKIFQDFLNESIHKVITKLKINSWIDLHMITNKIQMDLENYLESIRPQIDLGINSTLQSKGS